MKHNKERESFVEENELYEFCCVAAVGGFCCVDEFNSYRKLGLFSLGGTN